MIKSELATAARPRAYVARRSPRMARTSSAYVVHLLLIIAAGIMILPILLIVVNSFKTQVAIFSAPFTFPTAETFSIDGYVSAFTKGNFLVNYRNSFVVTVLSTLAAVSLGAAASFGIVRYASKLANIIFSGFMVGVMLPIQLGTVILLEMMVTLTLVNSIWSLIIIYVALSLPLCVVLLGNYFKAVPGEIAEAAAIDGASEFRTFSIMIPMVRPGLAAAAAISMLPIWNDLWFPLIFASSKESATVTLGVQQFVGQHSSDWPALIASLVISAVPLLILFLVFSRQFMAGISEGYGK